MSKSIQLFNALYYSYPDGFDALTDGTAFPSYLPGGGTAPFGGFVTLDTLSANELAALQTVGLNNVALLTSTTTGTQFHPTMWPYPDYSGTG
ncbi:hypothetical protein ACTGVV_12315, partial [Streptococcus suis]